MVKLGFYQNKMIQQFKLGKNALFLSLISLLTVISWVGFEVYKTSNKTTITKVTKKQMAPINPNIKTTVFEKIEKNLSLSEEELNTITTPEATQEAELKQETERETTESAQINEKEATSSSQTTQENDIVNQEF